MSDSEIILKEILKIRSDIDLIKKTFRIDDRLVDLNTAMQLSGLSAYKLRKIKAAIDHSAIGNKRYKANFCAYLRCK